MIDQAYCDKMNAPLSMRYTHIDNVSGALVIGGLLPAFSLTPMIRQWINKIGIADTRLLLAAELPPWEQHVVDSLIEKEYKNGLKGGWYKND